MKQRIKNIRKAAGLTQEQFGEKIGVGKMAVTYYEGGKRTPTETTIKLICSVFGVNEEWLRNGSGEPYADRSKEEEIARFVGEVEIMDDDSVIKQFISLLASMNKEQRDAFEIVGRMILEKRNQ